MAKEQHKKEKRETPIIDGDARPDMPVDPEKKMDQNGPESPGPRKKFESERSSDLNSLEDFKDAKEGD